jgi:polyhydroxyalkanoate synthase subunit PhaC
LVLPENTKFTPQPIEIVRSWDAGIDEWENFARKRLTFSTGHVLIVMEVERAGGSPMAEILTSDLIDSAVAGGELIAPIDTLGIAEAVLKVAVHTAANAAPRRMFGLAGELVRIAVGRSEVTPPPRDWRFANRAWQEHPFFRRLGQSYLAWCDAVFGVVDDAGLDWRTEERARFAATLFTAAVAPTNNPALNPDAIERAWETAGKSVGRGLRNVTKDVAHNRGMPRTVDRSAFELGRNLAATPGSVIFRNDLCELIQYAPSSPNVYAQPVVVVPPQINKFYVMDLSPGRSFIEYATSSGFQVFAISWRSPSSENGWWGMATYLDALDQAIRVAASVCGSETVSTVAICAGGITAATLLGQLAAHGDGLVSSATFAVTLLDFAERSTIGMLASPRLVKGATRSSARSGVLEGRGIGTLFAMLRPNDLIWNYWVNNNLLGEDPPQFDVLAWNADESPMPATLHADFSDIYLNNTLAQRQFKVRDTPIDLSKVECDSLVVAARSDHLTPWKACYATTQLLGGTSAFVLSSSGHIQSLVSPPRPPKMTINVGPEPTMTSDEWLAASEQRPGCWWEHWATWQQARAGEQHEAPLTLGDHRYEPIEPAPGRYVRGI